MSMHAACKQGDFRCNNGVCIKGVFHCDGFFHCNDRSDELDCDVKKPSMKKFLNGLRFVTNNLCL